MKKVFAALAAGMAFLAVSAITQGAEAAFVDSTKYCSDASYTGVLTTSAVDFTVDGGGTYGAADCYGVFGIKEAKDTVGNSEELVLEAIWQTGLVNLGKADVTNGGGSNFTAGSALDGLTITNISVTGTTTQNGETVPTGWTVSWQGELPKTINLAVLLKAAGGGDDAGSWWLPQILLHNGSSTGSGSFEIQWSNNGGQTPALSNIVLAAQLLQASEPASLALLGIGLAGLGLGVARRRRAV